MLSRPFRALVSRREWSIVPLLVLEIMYQEEVVGSNHRGDMKLSLRPNEPPARQ